MARPVVRAEILQILTKIWELEPRSSFGHLLHAVLQPEERMRHLYYLDDEFLLAALDSYLALARRRRASRRLTRRCS